METITGLDQIPLPPPEPASGFGTPSLAFRRRPGLYREGLEEMNLRYQITWDTFNSTHWATSKHDLPAGKKMPHKIIWILHNTEYYASATSS